jgi:IS1 family transposase
MMDGLPRILVNNADKHPNPFEMPRLTGINLKINAFSDRNKSIRQNHLASARICSSGSRTEHLCVITRLFQVLSWGNTCFGIRESNQAIRFMQSWGSSKISKRVGRIDHNQKGWVLGSRRPKFWNWRNGDTIIFESDPRRVLAPPLLFGQFQLALENPRGIKSGERYRKRQNYCEPIGNLGLVAMQMKSTEEQDETPDHLSWGWRIIAILAFVLWESGGLMIWRGAHIADEALAVGVSVITVGLVLMGLGLWMLHKVFLEVNPLLETDKIVTQKHLTSSYLCNTVSRMANVLSKDKQIAVIGSLAEGSSIRSIERLTGIHRDTIMRLGVRVGKGCEMLMDSKMQDLDCHYLQFDELWGFVGKKERHVSVDDSPEFGDAWTFCAIDAETKLVPCFKVGKRDHVTANAFVQDVATRMRNRVQISTDALRQYVEAIEQSFGADVDYGQIVKVYVHDSAQHPERKYSAPHFASAIRRPISGDPEMDSVSTSYIERLNATTRLHMRRLTRLTLAFSKKLENFEAAVGLHFAYYNFVLRHNSLRCTPAMAAGIEQDFWSVGDLVEAAS